MGMNLRNSYSIHECLCIAPDADAATAWTLTSGGWRVVSYGGDVLSAAATCTSNMADQLLNDRLAFTRCAIHCDGRKHVTHLRC
jgi:hypothetical protein